MSLRALLLSPDDQAVHAITSVLEEMSVSCDRPLDGATAAKKLNSEHFDLVVVDCDNLPAAKLIFDVCRRSHGGASVPVAVVDGRVGLPTAFRLGAELILTKPVAKDQARLTIRTAVTRTKKEQPAQEAKPADAAGATTVEKPEDARVPKAFAAAAGAASSGSLPTTVAAVEAAFVPTLPAAKAEAFSAGVPIEAIAPVKSSLAAEIATPLPPAILKPVVPNPAVVGNSEKQAASVPATPTLSSNEQLSEDPVMTALANDEPVQKSPTFSSFEQQPKPDRSRGLWIGTLLLAVAGGAGYAAWMYQPGVRNFIELRIQQGKTLLGLQQSTSGARPITSPAPAKPAPVSTATPSPAQQSSTALAPAATNSAAAPAVPSQNTPETTESKNVAAPSLAPEGSDNISVSAEPEKKIAASAVPASDFPEGRNAVILSSKGAEKRLIHRVKPVVPAAPRGRSAEATVVLKALIDENGLIKALQPVEGEAATTYAAMKAVKQWRYKPYTRDGKALPFQTIVLVDFQ